MKQITFPKGSITIKKIPKDPKAKPLPVLTSEDFQLHKDRTKWTSIIGKKSITMTPEIEKAFIELNNNVKKTRSIIKQSDNANEFNYEVTFKHPKWYNIKLLDGKVFGEIKIVSPRLNIKEAYEGIILRFKDRKKLAKEFKVKPSRYSGRMINSLQWKISYNKCAGVIHMPTLKNGVYLQFLKDQEKRIVFKDKTPTEQTTNYVGIELEFIASVNQEKLGYMLYDAGLGKYVKVTTDGSLRCTKHNAKHGEGRCDCGLTEYPHELCVIMKESERKEIMKKICEILSKVDARINKSCGVHVHLDMRNRNPEKCYQNLISAQHILYKMNPKSRSEIYARKVQDRDFDKVRNTPNTGLEHRYLGINPIAYNKLKTIEVRIHSGTIEFKKIDNWINILINVVNCSERLMKGFMSLKNFCDAFDIHNDLKEYMKERIDKFNPKDDVDGLTNIEPESGVA